MSLSLALQLRTYELLASKRMSSGQRSDARRRYVEAWSAGGVRRLIRELEEFPNMDPDELDWAEIEAEMDGTLPFLEQ